MTNTIASYGPPTQITKGPGPFDGPNTAGPDVGPNDARSGPPDVPASFGPPEV